VTEVCSTNFLLHIKQGLCYSNATLFVYIKINVDLWTRLCAGQPGFDSWQGQTVCIFATTSRMALEPNQPPTQWVSGAFSPGVKQPRREANHSEPPYVFMERCLVKHRDYFTVPLQVNQSYVLTCLLSQYMYVTNLWDILWAGKKFVEQLVRPASLWAFPYQMYEKSSLVGLWNVNIWYFSQTQSQSFHIRTL
jgi:hypothetical protein